MTHVLVTEDIRVTLARLLDRRNQTEQETSDESNSHCKHQDRSVDADLIETRQVRTSCQIASVEAGREYTKHAKAAKATAVTEHRRPGVRAARSL
jgi:hypothetical protein